MTFDCSTCVVKVKGLCSHSLPLSPTSLFLCCFGIALFVDTTTTAARSRHCKLIIGFQFEKKKNFNCTALSVSSLKSTPSNIKTHHLMILMRWSTQYLKFFSIGAPHTIITPVHSRICLFIKAVMIWHNLKHGRCITCFCTASSVVHHLIMVYGAPF